VPWNRSCPEQNILVIKSLLIKNKNKNSDIEFLIEKALTAEMP
jgi:predicted nucleotidyltransferase